MPLRNPLKARKERRDVQLAHEREEAEWELERESASQRGNLRWEEREIKGRQIALDRKTRMLELKKKEREYKKQEREYRHPKTTRAMRRAEQMMEGAVSTAKQVPARATMEGASRLRRSAGRVRVTPTTTRIPRDKPGRTRLPVFQEGAPSMSERIAMDFGLKTPEESFPQQQQRDILGVSKQYDLGIGGKQYDLGLGNGNKKKTRYY